MTTDSTPITLFDFLDSVANQAARGTYPGEPDSFNKFRANINDLILASIPSSRMIPTSFDIVKAKSDLPGKKKALLKIVEDQVLLFIRRIEEGLSQTSEFKGNPVEFLHAFKDFLMACTQSRFDWVMGYMRETLEGGKQITKKLRNCR